MTTETTHPGPASATLTAELIEEIVEHLRAAYPNEGCGVIVGDRSPAAGGQPTRFVPMRNAAESPLRFRIDEADLIALDDELDRTDENFWAIVHSHVGSPAYPSPTDVAVTPVYVNQLHLVVSLADEQPDLGLFRIVDGVIHRVELVVGGPA
ncbi:MAG TPA: M67 family metallopeptidase [Candidatus Limnocylindrales bacterium]|nr:M67 family metallopeptidase [Candidatus Limnocylindrales bacterium]